MALGIEANKRSAKWLKIRSQELHHNAPGDFHVSTVKFLQYTCIETL